MSSWAGGLIRLARYDAGISQEQLAELAGLPEETLTAYESGEQPLTLDELARIVRAAGQDLRIHVVPYDDHDDLLAAQEASLPEATRQARNKKRLETINRAREAQGLGPVTEDDLVGPTPGAGVDRTVIRELLKLTPRERLDLAVEEANNLKRLEDERDNK